MRRRGAFGAVRCLARGIRSGRLVRSCGGSGLVSSSLRSRSTWARISPRSGQPVGPFGRVGAQRVGQPVLLALGLLQAVLKLRRDRLG